MSVKAPSIGFVSLGCPKATVDSERILTQLKVEGYAFSGSYEEADLVIVNTCGFIEAAEEESLEAIGEALHVNGKVIVTGCLGAKESLIRERHPEVLAVTGAHEYEAVMQAVHEHLPPDDRHAHLDLLPASGIKLTPRHYAYLKISEGCNHHCSFCIIPSMRGTLVSRPVGEVMREAERLVEDGVKELLVIAQDTSAYGLDLKYRTDFVQGRPVRSRFFELCEELGKLDAWIRLHYVYPYPHVDEVIPLMRDGLILPYLDVPLQHASESVIRAMKRPAAGEKMLERIHKWREICPELVIRSTFIVGFPGETEKDFEELLDFIDKAQLDRVGCFAYSPVEGAAANDLPGQIPEAEKARRLEAFMARQAEISAAKLQGYVGCEMAVLIDEVRDDAMIARSFADAPEVDGTVIIPGSHDLQPGQFIDVEIVDSGAFDLTGMPLLHEPG